jgi:hypothetical protein
MNKRTNKVIELKLTKRTTKPVQTSKKNRGWPFESNNNKKNLDANNVVQKHNVPKEREKLFEQHTRTFYV